MTQKAIALESEGDAFMARHQYHKLDIERIKREDPVIQELISLRMPFENVLEIGCANGYRLAALNEIRPGRYFGIDPSSEAIESGKRSYKGIQLKVGTADFIPFDIKFDIIIFGFCLYLVDRSDLFKIASVADEHLKPGGVIVILDFYSKYYRKKEYAHDERINTHKFPYHNMFLWNSDYHLTTYKIVELYNAKPREMAPEPVYEQLQNLDSCVSLSLIYKSFL